MATTRELIQQLYDRRRTLVEQQRELHAKVEADLEGEFSGETEEAWGKLDKDITELGQRIDHLITIEEQAKEAEAQRERFEKLIENPRVQADGEREMTQRIRNWMKAGLPDAEVWAPKAIEVRFESMSANVDGLGRQNLERHDLTKGTATDGAELIPTGFVRTLQEHLIANSGIRRTNAQVFTTASGENLLVPKTTGHGTATLVAEAGPLLENDPQFAQVTLTSYKFGQLIQVSRELVEDSAVDLLGYLARAAGTAIGVVTDTYFTTGTGTAQPEGVANAPTAGKTGTTGQTTTVTSDDLIDLYHSIVEGYRARGFWLMNDLTAAAVRKIKDTTGQYVWQPGLQAGQPDSLLNRPVVTDPNMAAMAANAYSIAFGDFSAYFAIRDVNSVRFERSDDFAFANDLVSFRSILRTDSKQLINGASGAVKFYRNSAT